VVCWLTDIVDPLALRKTNRVVVKDLVEILAPPSLSRTHSRTSSNSLTPSTHIRFRVMRTITLSFDL
jgi:hypothetical protein